VRLRRRQLTKQQHPGLKDAFQVLQNVGIGEGEERRFLSHLRGRDIQAVATLLRERKNTDHGTSVAGLICWGIQLNPTIASLDDGPCGVYDLQVIRTTIQPKAARCRCLNPNFFRLSMRR
jgi:hypothetical protein